MAKGLQRIMGFESKAGRDEHDVMKFIMHLGSDVSDEPSLKEQTGSSMTPYMEVRQSIVLASATG